MQGSECKGLITSVDRPTTVTADANRDGHRSDSVWNIWTNNLRNRAPAIAAAGNPVAASGLLWIPHSSSSRSGSLGGVADRRRFPVSSVETAVRHMSVMACSRQLITRGA